MRLPRRPSSLSAASRTGGGMGDSSTDRLRAASSSGASSSVWHSSARGFLKNFMDAPCGFGHYSLPPRSRTTEGRLELLRSPSMGRGATPFGDAFVLEPVLPARQRPEAAVAKHNGAVFATTDS